MTMLKDVGGLVGALATGLKTTVDTALRKPVTQLYPYTKPDLPPVSCQSLALIVEDGQDRCVSCLQCEVVCPSQVITIERRRATPPKKGFVLERFDIDLVNCMYCAACVEACPVSAIVTIQDFEQSTYDLATLKADKLFLDELGNQAPQWYSPKLGVEYRDPKTGKITVAPPEQQPGGAAPGGGTGEKKG